jgi:UDP-2,4-diacetamido-2,4,6-trideoxy-beta-L-altropyranose hydrolase
MRCATLARELMSRGMEASFICRDHVGSLGDVLEAQGFGVHRLPSSGSDTAGGNLLGGSWEDDAAAVGAILSERRQQPDWLVVDHYEIDARWEQRLRPHARRIMVIDDMANRPHDCDLLLDQNLVAHHDVRYEGLVPSSCRKALGPSYALLQTAYAELHDRVPPRSGTIQRILVSFGGSDATALVERCLRALLAADRPDIIVDVVGPVDRSACTAAAKGFGDVRFHNSVPSLASLIVAADLALGAAGATTWERLCLGLPAVAITVAENQRPIAEELQRRGLLVWAGDASVSDETLERTITSAIHQGSDETASIAAAQVVDGRGTQRIASAMTLGATSPLSVRYAVLEDETPVLEWANDPVTRRSGFAPDRIDTHTHRRWFRARLRQIEDCHFFIAQTDQAIPVGQVRFQRCDGGWEVHYATAPLYRGLGLGRSILRVALERFAGVIGSGEIVGRVRATNMASRRIFEVLGFRAHEQADGDELEFHCTIADAHNTVNA